MGKLFVIDGTDGSGKQTQLEKLKERFEKDGIDYKLVSFPNYDSPSSSLVKMYLAGEFGENAKDVSPYIASTFFAADRYATYKKGIEEFYNNGGIIIADRYTTSNMVHQAAKYDDYSEKDKFLQWLDEYEFDFYGLPRPTKVFFLNMPVEFSFKLMKNRKNKITGNVKKDIHEANKDYLEKSYENALYVAKKYGWENIDCTSNDKLRQIKDIHEEIYSLILKSLKSSEDGD